MLQPQLSKSEYMMYLRHPAWLWLKKHDKKKLPEVDANTQAIFDAGNLFEEYAEERFGDIVRVGFNSYQEYLSMPERTKQALDNGAKTLTQGRFEADFDTLGSITCICDVLVATGDKRFDVYEIKSSTRVKADHIEDLAFQVTVLQLAGYEIGTIGVVYCDNTYVRRGAVDPLALSTAEDVTEQVLAKLSTTKRLIADAFAIVGENEMPDPTPRRTKMGANQDWLEIFLSLKPTDDPYSIYKLAQAQPEQLGRLEDMHIATIADIPSDFTLKSTQARQVEVTKAGEPHIELNKIQKYIDGLEYPLYFLDYETLGSLIPLFDGLKPYQQLPFQYSLHILERPGGELKHVEYLHQDDTNPLVPLVESMQQAIGDKGSVLVWYEAFEKGCNELMAHMLADSRPELSDFLHVVNTRVVDLMVPFARGYYAHADFYGSASIKKVLPVIAPELSYSDMEISEGGSAQRLWMEAVHGNSMDESAKAKVMRDLIDYCGLDTLAMVKIYEFLVDLAEGSAKPVGSSQATVANKLEQQSLF